MKFKYCVAIFAIVGLPSFVQAQQGGAPPKGPKPTAAEVQKVVGIIKGDKTKMQLFCDLGKMEEQFNKAEQAKDNKKLEELDKQAEGMAQKIGPEYVKLMSTLEQVDNSDKEVQQLTAPLDTLAQQCPK
jgi:hypothetical protein